MRVFVRILLIGVVLSVVTMPSAAALAGYESRYDAYDSYYDEPYPYDDDYHYPPPYEYDDYYYRPRGGVTFALPLPVPAFQFGFGHWGHGRHWGGGDGHGWHGGHRGHGGGHHGGGHHGGRHH